MFVNFEKYFELKKFPEFKNYCKKKEEELNKVLKFIRDPNSETNFEEFFHSIDSIIEKTKGKIDDLVGLIPVNNLDGKNSLFCAVSTALFGDVSKFHYIKLGVFYTLKMNDKLSEALIHPPYDDYFFKAVAETLEKKIKIYTIGSDQSIICQDYGDEKFNLSIMLILDIQNRYHFIPLLKEKKENSNTI
jgi:hypothetical protein